MARDASARSGRPGVESDGGAPRLDRGPHRRADCAATRTIAPAPHGRETVAFGGFGLGGRLPVAVAIRAVEGRTLPQASGNGAPGRDMMSRSRPARSRSRAHRVRHRLEVARGLLRVAFRLRVVGHPAHVGGRASRRSARRPRRSRLRRSPRPRRPRTSPPARRRARRSRCTCTGGAGSGAWSGSSDSEWREAAGPDGGETPFGVHPHLLRFHRTSRASSRPVAPARRHAET